MIRNWLRLLRSVCGAGGTFLIACAYGPVETEGRLASGRVTHQGSGLEGLSVCAQVGGNSLCVRSGTGGSYAIEAMPGILDQAGAGFSLCAEDDTGVSTTPLARTCRDVPPDSVPAAVDIEMQEP